MKIFEEIEKQIKSNKKVVVGIDGPSASGKSTLGNMLKDKYNALLFHADHYFLPPEMKTSERLSESGGNVDYLRLEQEIMKQLDSDYIVSNHFNCKTNELEKRDQQKNNQVIIIEGAYSLHENLFPYYTLSIFLEIDEELQKNRISARNGEVMLQKWINEWIPLENTYFEKEDLKNKVNILIDLNIKNYYFLS